MTRRHSPRVREQAALLCQMAASTYLRGDQRWSFTEPCDAIGVDCFEDGGAADLARSAYWSVEKWCDLNDSLEDRIAAIYDDAPVHWAEAEAMLRTGQFP